MSLLVFPFLFVYSRVLSLCFFSLLSLALARFFMALRLFVWCFACCTCLSFLFWIILVYVLVFSFLLVSFRFFSCLCVSVFFVYFVFCSFCFVSFLLVSVGVFPFLFCSAPLSYNLLAVSDTTSSSLLMLDPCLFLIVFPMFVLRRVSALKFGQLAACFFYSFSHHISRETKPSTIFLVENANRALMFSSGKKKPGIISCSHTASVCLLSGTQEPGIIFSGNLARSNIS